MVKNYKTKPPKDSSDDKHDRRVGEIVAKSQRQKFIDKARELGCDEGEEAFRDKLKRMAKAPSKPGRATDKPDGTTS